jgi:hypothetical protein
MLAYIVAIAQAIKALFELVKMFQNWKIQQEKAAAEKRQQELEKAVDQSKKAETDEDIWKSQDDIVANKPGN